MVQGLGRRRGAPYSRPASASDFMAITMNTEMRLANNDGTKEKYSMGRLDALGDR